MQDFFRTIDSNSWLLLMGIFVSLSLAAFLGKFTWGRKPKRDPINEDGLKIVLGATLSLFGLLLGFILSFAISGYNTRVTAEENEAIAIGNALQRTTLLQAQHQGPAQKMLLDYLQLRIQFFDSSDDEQRAQARLASIRMQTRMWVLISNITKANPDPILTTALNACNDLYTTQQKTMASWRHQIPVAAWVILLVFGLCSNFLIGYNIRGDKHNALIFITPAVTALALFMIAEIDVPGKGIIHVQPDNLKTISITLAHGGLIQ